jgi:tripartite-type tricarboxylate transporter receptor subunit TctC
MIDIVRTRLCGMPACIPIKPTQNNFGVASEQVMRFSLFAKAALLVVLLTSPSAAQEWPTKPVRIVVPFAAGGASDNLGRLIAERLAKALGQQFIIDNRGGAAGMIGSATVATAEPDGYTLLISGNASNVIAPAFYKTAPYNGVTSFAHIAYLGGVPAGLFVHSSLPVSNYREFLAWAKAENKAVDFVSSGTATYGYLFGIELGRKEGLTLNHIPYKGAGPAMLDLVAGHVRVATISFSTGAEHVRSGTLRALGISSNERLPGFPDVPTFKELGHPDMTSGSWFAISGPANLPASIVSKLNHEVRKILQDPEVRKRLDNDTFVPRDMSPEDLQKFFVSETDRWAPIAKALSVSAK